ncbi:MAG: protein-tyrosine-phosphatase [Gammaproteobacteria bacterium]|nr:MAG: protein-tyrosine-phosphatase [Gammaproteobacteria bacterium]
MTKTTPQSVLVVCLGNICRSPMAEQVLRQKTNQAGLSINLDSCGTAHWHEGKLADARSRTVTKSRDYDINHLRARHIKASDFTEFDLILAMDKDNLANLQNMKNKLIAKGKTHLATLALFSEHDTKYRHQNVPDPYYGDIKDFEQALDLIESMADSWINKWQ